MGIIQKGKKILEYADAKWAEIMKTALKGNVDKAEKETRSGMLRQTTRKMKKRKKKIDEAADY